jgi:hypothetical protein
VTLIDSLRPLERPSTSMALSSLVCE